MNKLLLFVFLISCVACTQEKPEPSDDYVLIEFAAKLEEDYAKLNPSEQKTK